MALNDTPNKLESVWIQRNPLNQFYEQVNISGSNLIVYHSSSGELMADRISVFATKYGLGGAAGSQVKVSVTDTTTGYLSGSKLFPGNNISFSIANPGGNEALVIHSSGGGTGLATGSTYPFTSSQALTASYVLNSGTSFGLATGSTYPITSSQSVSSSWSRITDIGNANVEYAPLLNANLIGTNGGGTSLFAFNPSTGSFRATLFLGSLTGSSYGTASFANSSSYALTASYAMNGGGIGGGLATGSTYPITASQALTASYALNAGTGGGLSTGSTYPFTSSQSISSSWSRITDIGNQNIDYAPLLNASLIGTNGGGTSLFAFNPATGSFRATLFLGTLTGSSYGTSSFAISASYALNVFGLATGSTYPFTSSQSITASYWNSSSINSWTNNNFQFKIATGSTLPITSSQSITASYALNAGTSFGLATGSTYPITSSQSVSSSWSRITDIGNANVEYAPLLNASLIGTNGGGTSIFAFNTATGSFRATLFLGSLTGSSYGTASFANSSSYALTASYALNGGLATGSTYPITASQSATSSYALTASYALNGFGLATGSTYPITASCAVNALSASGGLAVGGYHQGLINTSSVQLGFGIPKNQHSNINVQIGYGVNANSISSSGEVAIGYEAGKDTANGNQAVKIGFWAGKTSITSDLAVQIGNEVAGNSTTASQAVQIGHDAAKNSTDASIAIQIGSGAGYDAKSALGAVMIGYHAGYNAATGSYSTLIGTNADTYSSSLSITRSIAIGYNAKVSASRTAAIGGTGADSIKVTIGGTSAVNTLDVIGNISCSVITASLFGSASYAISSLTSSYLSQSVLGGGIYRIESISSASYALLSPPNPTTLYVISSSEVPTFDVTASYAIYALTASYALNGGLGGGGLATGSTYPITSSQAISSSYALSASYSLSSSFAVTASYISSAFSIVGTASYSLYTTNSLYALTASYLYTSTGVLYFLSASAIATGTSSLALIPTSSFDGCFINYIAKGSPNLRAGNLSSIWSGSSINHAEAATADLGNTAGLTFNLILSSSFAVFQAENRSSTIYQIKATITSM
jgi:hypothetical protein